MSRPRITVTHSDRGVEISGTPDAIATAFHRATRAHTRSRPMPTTATDPHTDPTGQATLPGVEPAYKNEWRQIEALRVEAESLLATAQVGARAASDRGRRCAAVLAKLSSQMLEAAEKMQDVLTKD